MKNKIMLAAVTSFFIVSCSSNSPRDTSEGSGEGSDACAGLDYQANGKKYRTLSSALGYTAEGVAQIYRNKGQGDKTASCESFDLNGFTAAHRTLPLPTHIKITNKNNNKSVVVKVNDRGPSNPGSLILVTPAVANLLGAASDFPAQIKAITSTSIRLNTPLSQTATTRKGTRAANYLSRTHKSVDHTNADRYYIVVGTFTSRNKAFDRFVRISSIGLPNVAMESRKIKGQFMHMVRLGPYYDQDQIDNAKDRLKNDGLISFKVVKN